MDLNVKKICFSCMKTKKSETGPCNFCGYDNSTYEKNPNALGPLSPLNGRYLTGKVLGIGGFGITYVAWDINLQVRVAIKELCLKGINYRIGGRELLFKSEDRIEFEESKKRFLKEARTLAELGDANNQGIVSVKEYFEENDTAYIVMEYLEGKTLKGYVRDAGGQLPIKQIIKLLDPVVDSLSIVHSNDVVHKDISPDNIMVLKNGVVKLLDFGGAIRIREGESAQISYKKGYAPPEQYAENGNIGPWTDIYSLAGTVYYCLTGKKPEDAMKRKVGKELLMPSYYKVKTNKKFDKAITKALELDYSKRYQDIDTFWRDIKKSQKHTGRNISISVFTSVVILAAASFFLYKNWSRIAIEEGTYVIANYDDTKMVMGITDHIYESGASVTLGTDEDSNSQKFYVKAKNKKYFYISAVSSDKALTYKKYESADGGGLVQWEFEDEIEPNQIWRIRSAGKGAYYIMSSNGEYVGCQGGEAKEGKSVETKIENKVNDAAKWVLISTRPNETDMKAPVKGTVMTVKEGSYRIVPFSDQAKSIDLRDSGYAISDQRDSAGQKFIINKADNKTYLITAVKANELFLGQGDSTWKFVADKLGSYRILDQSDQAVSLKSDNSITMEPLDDGNDSQRWMLEKVDVSPKEEICRRLNNEATVLINRMVDDKVIGIRSDSTQEGAALFLVDDRDSISQYFSFSKGEDQYYEMKNDYSGMYVSVIKGVDKVSRLVEKEPVKWAIKEGEMGYFLLENEDGQFLSVNEDMEVIAADEISEYSQWQFRF